MQSYLEELDNGDSFEYEDNKFVVTTDYKQDSSRLCICLKDGSSRWLASNCIVNKIQLFIMDKDNCIIAIKETKKDVTT